MQTIITHIIFALAATYTIYQIYVALFRKAKCSSCISGTCNVEEIKRKVGSKNS